MAEEPWNRVNIPFPGAVSSVRIHFTNKSDVLVKDVLLGNETVLKLIDSEILQTEMRVLYELLYILNNSYRGNKTYKGLQQVEQCMNRLKTMKLVEALYELTDLCPNKIQRNVGKKTGECNVPSQPMLEWLCLKVLGAAHLMSCTLQRCSRAFLLCNQQMKWAEFLVLNMVITSMLSRLWVILRGVLVSLSTLYESILGLCREVAKTKPMPFLTASALPPNMSELLDPVLLLDKTYNCDLKPFVNIFKTFTKVRKSGLCTSVVELILVNCILLVTYYLQVGMGTVSFFPRYHYFNDTCFSVIVQENSDKKREELYLSCRDRPDPDHDTVSFSQNFLNTLRFDEAKALHTSKILTWWDHSLCH
uniref:Nucleolus and neural progenitor protein-like N-terminal domain-containing protein n=1 Tax=Neogobius melanostomus TaxID=47308 RepID=A0A8C6UYH7_9GOBI